MIRSLLHSCLIACFWLVGLATLPAATSLDELLGVQKKVQSALTDARRAVVAIECHGGTASGVIVTPGGLVLTAAHVTGGAGKLVKITLYDGRTVEGKSLGLDTATDAAMVQMPTPARAWPWMPVSRDVRALQIGDWCFDVAHPGGFDKSRGSVVRVGKILKIASNMVQTDCVLMGGDSGGPLFNLAGEVIGVNSQIWRGRDQNQHVSMNPFLRSWDALRKGSEIHVWELGAGGWAGISTEVKGVQLCIAAMAPGSPAQKAGLKEGEAILTLDNKAMATPADFSSALRTHAAGELITLKVRGGEGERIVEVKLGRKPSE